jgi:hypothetical protein
MSFGGTAPSDVLADVIAYAVSKGVVPVAAAGNYDVWVPFYPAGYPDVISVASTDENDAKSFFSNYSSYSEHGELIDVAAPGEAIWSTAIPGSDLGCADTDGDGYSACSGTSMAAPLVSGALGLIRSHAASSLGQIKTLIHSFADPVVSTEYIARRPDAFMAVSKAPGIGQGVLENSCGYCGGGPISFTGSASGSGFQNYVIEYGTGVYPANWTVFKNSATPVANGTLGILDPVAQGLATGIYTIRLTVTASGSTMTDYAVLYIDADLAAGWPKQLVDGCVGCESFVAAAIADVNGDGDGEIFFTTVTEDTTPGTFVMHLHGIEHTGTPLPGFPIFLNTPYVNIPPLRSPAIADIDGDGTYEIVVGSSTGIGSAMVTSVHMFNANGTVQSGWPVTIGPIGGTQSTSRKAATLANLDGGNDLEIIFIEGKCIGGCNQETVHVYKSNGQPLAGWPQDIAAFGNDTVAVGDIDADGDQELVFGGGSTVYVYNADGTPYGSGWPKAAITSSGFDISLADIDGNDGGKLEVISQKWTTPTLYVHNHDGTSVFSKSLPNASIPPYIILEPVIGDLNGSSPLNIIARGRDKLYAFTNTGANVPGWPITGPDYTAIGVNSAVMIDLEGDGSREILFNGTRYTGVANPVDWGQLFGYRADGTVAPQFPKTVKQPFLLMSAGKVAPGGKVNLFVIDGGGTGYLWEWAGTASTDAFQWPTFRHDMLRTGLGPVPGSGGGSPPPPPTDTLPPSAPGTLNASPGSGQANLTWGAALDNVAIGGYRITAATKSSFASNFIHPAWNDTFVGNVLNFPVTGLLGGTTYYFRVRAEDTSGNLGPYSNIAEAAPF